MTTYAPVGKLSWWVSISISLAVMGAIIFPWTLHDADLLPLVLKSMATLFGLLGIFMVIAWSIWSD